MAVQRSLVEEKAAALLNIRGNSAFSCSAQHPSLQPGCRILQAKLHTSPKQPISNVQPCARPAHRGFRAAIRDTGTVGVGGPQNLDGKRQSLLPLTEQTALQSVREEVGSFNAVLHLLACLLIFELP